MSDRTNGPFRAGDVCVIIRARFAPNRVGTECVLIGRDSTTEEWELDLPDGARPSFGGYFTLPDSCLRLKRPPSKDDAEPRADFTPAEDEFRDWLKSHMRERA